MRYLITLLTAVVILTGCRRNKDNAGIVGKIDGLKPDTTDIIIYGYDLNYERIDTVGVVNGSFNFSTEVDTITLLTLRFNDTLSYPVFIDRGNKIKINGSINKGKAEINVKGNEISEELSRMLNILGNRDSLNAVPLRHRVESYINANPSSLVSAYLLARYIAYSKGAKAEDVEAMVKKLAGSLSDNILISTLNEQIQLAKRATSDKYAPIFNLKNDKGDEINRSKTFNDKYLLITFWASWDKASRTNNIALRKLSKEMKKRDKDFGMLGIALDMDKEEWREAMKRDSLSWEQVCETAMFNSDVAEQYGVTTLPVNMLIAPNGKIIERGIPIDSVASRIDQELQKKKEQEAKAKLVMKNNK